MIYYMKLEKDKELLEIKEAKSIHQLSNIMHVAWGDIKFYLDDMPSQRLNCGIPMPFIKKDMSMYLISYHKELMEYRNRKFMSYEVYNDLEYMDRFDRLESTPVVIKRMRDKMEEGGDGNENC